MDFVLIDEALIDRCLDNGGRNRVDADASTSQLHRKMVREGVKACLGHRVRGGRSRRDCLPGPHRSNVYDTPGHLPLNHIPRYRLCDKEQRLVDAQISVVVLDGVVKEGPGNEDPSSIHQVACIRMPGVDSRAQRVDLGYPREIGLFAAYGAEVSKFLDRFCNAVVATSDHDCGTAALQEQSDNHLAYSTCAPNHNQLPSSELPHCLLLSTHCSIQTLSGKSGSGTSRHNSVGWEQNGMRSMKSEEKRILRRAAPRYVGRMVETVVGCKWSLTVLDLVERGVVRPGEMERTIEGLTAKVLNDCLRRLVQFKVLEKRSYAEIPPRVEYRFTDFGRKFRSACDALDELEADFEAAQVDTARRGL